jgi:hypothetical protein
MFDKAYHVAFFPNSSKLKADVHDLSLLHDLIAQPKLPPLLRAHLLAWQATLALEAGEVDEWLMLSNQAESAFRDEGHQSGPLFLELERLHGHPHQRLPDNELKAATIRLKDAFRGLGCWDGVKSCMRRLSEIAVYCGDDAALAQLDTEYDEMRSDCMTTLDWTNKEELLLRYWDFQKHHTPMLAKSFEDLYQIYASGDMPVRAAMIAFNLSKLYRDMGDNVVAEQWVTRMVEDVPSRYMPSLYAVNPLIRHLEGTGNLLTLEEEVTELSQFLTNCKERCDGHIARFETCQIIESIFYIQPLYLQRAFPEYKQLSSMCFETIQGLLPHSAPGDLVKYSAKLCGRRGDLMFHEAGQTSPPSWELLVDSYNTFSEAIGILQSVNHRGYLEFWTLYSGLGQAAQSLWYVESMAAGYCSTRDSTFLDADEYFRASLNFAAKEEHMSAMQLAMTRLHSLWLVGARHSEVSKADADTVESLRRQCHDWLIRAKELLEKERRDHSILSKKSSAVTGKQSVRAALPATTLYQDAFGLSMLLQSPQYLWIWVQDSKARSVSDLLALGTNIPETLRDAIESNPTVRQLFGEESNLKRRLETAEGAAAIVLHQQLDSLRELMAKDQLADAVLALREGRPTTLEALQAAAQLDVEPASIGASIRSDTRLENLALQRAGPKRRIFFVDYGFHQDNGFMLVALDDQVRFFWTNVTTQEAAAWKAMWLVDQPPETPISPGGAVPYHPRLREEESSALEFLSRLVKPLVSISAPGDLLVLCPSETIHGIPLHAAQTGTDDDDVTCLIERNPVVYAASMTVTVQCMARATTRTNPPTSGTNTILGVYRHPQEIRDMGTRISARFDRPCDVQVSDRLERSALQAACASSKTVLFFGHCDVGSRPGAQHLVLDDTPAPAGRLLPVAGDLFTVDDVFATRVTASHLTLVACGSAALAIQPGDEPLGLLTALLCSGANSVIGTMWPVEARAGVAFAEAFYRRLAVLTKTAGVEGKEDGGGRDSAERRTIDLAVVLQETVVELKRSRRPGYNTENVVHWGAFTLNGAWLMDV